MMRTLLIAALAAATLSSPLAAQDYGRGDRGGYQNDRGGYQNDRGGYQNDRGGYQNGYQGGRGGDPRNYDYNRPPQGGYYADRYYRAGRPGDERRLGRNDRIYRGRDGRYYCRRNDGSTGLVVGAVAGGLLGNTIAGGGSKLLGTVLGGAGGALLGKSIDQGNVRCR